MAGQTRGVIPAKSGKPVKDDYSNLLLSNVSVTKDVLFYGTFGEIYAAEMLGAASSARLLVTGSLSNKITVSTLRRWKSLRHPAIVTLFGLSIAEQLAWIVTEMVDIKLDDLLRTLPRSDFPFRAKANLLRDVSSALCYLCSLEPPIIFEELKADHVFVTADLRGKLDLGVLLPNPNRHTYHNSDVHLSWYDPSMPYHLPQVKNIDDTSVDLKIQTVVFSFGTLCLHALIHEVPAPKGLLLQDAMVEVSSNGKEMLTLLSEEDVREPYIQMLAGEERRFLPLIKMCIKDYPKSRPPLEVVSKEISLITRQFSIGKSCSLLDLMIAIEYVDQEVATTRNTTASIQYQLRQLLALPDDYPILAPNSPSFGRSNYGTQHRNRSNAISQFTFRGNGMDPRPNLHREKSMTLPAPLTIRTATVKFTPCHGATPPYRTIQSVPEADAPVAAARKSMRRPAVLPRPKTEKSVHLSDSRQPISPLSGPMQPSTDDSSSTQAEPDSSSSDDDSVGSGFYSEVPTQPRVRQQRLHCDSTFDEYIMILSGSKESNPTASPRSDREAFVQSVRQKRRVSGVTCPNMLDMDVVAAHDDSSLGGKAAARGHSGPYTYVKTPPNWAPAKKVSTYEKYI